MYKRIISLKYLLVIAVILFGCEKQAPLLSNEQKEQNAILEIKNIVNNNGKIELLPKSSSSGDQIDLKTTNNENTASGRFLSLSEFKFLYENVDNYKYERIIEKDTNVNIKTMEFDDPGKPGLHRVKYYAFPFNITNGTYGINDTGSSLTFLNLWYETNNQGMVIGSPIIFYSGLSVFQNWTQLYVSQIQYNANNNTSTFSIAGTTLYGINVFGQNIGWTTPGGFNIKICMSPTFGDDGDIRILGWR